MDMISRLGFSGSRSLVADDESFIRSTLQLLDMDMFLVGGCIGADAVAGRFVGNILNRNVQVFLPADRSRVDPDYLEYADHVHELPPGSSYRARNQAIVRHSTELVAFPSYREEHGKSLRSGTWQTIRLAVAKGIPVTIHVLRSRELLRYDKGLLIDDAA
jgi:hypothetical protein